MSNIENKKTRNLQTTWLQTLAELLPGINPEPLTADQYKQSLILVVDSSTDYIPFSEIYSTDVDYYHHHIFPLLLWLVITLLIPGKLYAKAIGIIIYIFLMIASYQNLLSGYTDTILGGDLERPFTFLRPTVKGVPGIGVKKINHEDFLAIKSSPTIMYLTKNNWIKNIQGDYGFLVPAKAFFQAATEAKIEARNLSDLTSNFLSNDAIATSKVRNNAGTGINDHFAKRAMTFSRVGFYMAYSMIVWITFINPNLTKVTTFLVKSIVAILLSLCVAIFDIIKITPAAINKTLILKRNLMFLAYSVCVFALL